MEHFDPDRSEVIARARAAGVVRLITVSSFIGDAEDCAALAALHDFIHFTAGVHPHEAKSFTPEAEEEIRRAAALPRAVAIGEIGLDYHYDFSPREAQRRVFRAQVALARDLKLPVVIHTREAWDDTLRILGDERASEIGGVFHCFSGGTAEARRCLDLGFFLSFAGPVTFKNACDLAEAATYAPLDRVLCETDSPYLTPHPHRGKRNEPANVLLVAAKIAALKGLTPEAVGEATTRNLEAVFRLA
jgi:TatD DNase family protein